MNPGQRRSTRRPAHGYSHSAVYQNRQAVRVHFLFLSGRAPLIWVILACVVAGATLGSILRGRATRTRRLRREERDLRRHGEPGMGL